MEIDKKALQQMLMTNDIKTMEDLQALLRDLTKEMIDSLYEGELTAHLGYERHAQGAEKGGNYRSGHGKKTVKSHLGEIELSPPRDRLGVFDPVIVRKCQTDISGLEMKVISMYGKGMTTRDIRDYIYDIYGYDLSAESIGAITDKVIETAKEWQNRALRGPGFKQGLTALDLGDIRRCAGGGVENSGFTDFFRHGLPLFKCELVWRLAQPKVRTATLHTFFYFITMSRRLLCGVDTCKRI